MIPLVCGHTVLSTALDICVSLYNIYTSVCGAVTRMSEGRQTGNSIIVDK